MSKFWKEATVLGVGLAAFGFVFSLVDKTFSSRQTNAPRSICQSNMKQMGLGFMQYVEDYDEKFPLPSAGNGWADNIQPYLKSTKIYQCPSEPNSPPSPKDPTQTGYIDYYYNAQLQSVSQEKIEKPISLVLSGEGNDGEETTDGRYSKKEVPPSWENNPDSPAFRHLETANYLFVDGHVKSFSTKKLADLRMDRQFTFQPPVVVKSQTEGGASRFFP